MGVNWNAINNGLSAAVVESGRLEGLLAALGVEVRSGRWPKLRGPCPVHGGDDPNFEVCPGGHTLPVRWACYSYGCHKIPPLKNNLLGLVRGALGEPGRPAPLGRARQFVERFLRESGPPTRTRVPRPPPAPAAKPLALTRDQVRGALAIPSPYFVARGFAPAVLDRYDIGHSEKLGRAVAPVYDDAGRTCVGFTSRSVEPPCPYCGDGHPADLPCFLAEPRWMNSGGFPKGNYLFGYAAARQTSAPFVLLVEGVPDVLRAAEAGIPAVACLGVDLSDAHAEKLAALDRAVVVAFDNDDPGRKGAGAAAGALRRAGVAAEVRHPPEGVKDVGEMNAADLKAWAAGAVPVAC